jgi:hypothetical protein
LSGSLFPVFESTHIAVSLVATYVPSQSSSPYTEGLELHPDNIVPNDSIAAIAKVYLRLKFFFIILNP